MAQRMYVYYRVALAALPATAAAAHQMQAALLAAHPGLQAELLRRPGAPAGEVTLMEVYAGPLTPALQAAITQATATLPQPRHSERFETLPNLQDRPDDR